MTQPLENPQVHNNEATANRNVDEVDTEMADTTEEDVTTTPQEDCLPALEGDEDMRDTEQEQAQNNEGIMEEDAEPGRAEGVPDSQEQLGRGENETGNTAEHETTEGEYESESSVDENEDNDDDADTEQNHPHEEQPAVNPKNVARTTLTQGTGAPMTKGIRVQLASRPTILKKKEVHQRRYGPTNHPFREPRTLLVMLRQNKRSSSEHPPDTLPRAAHRRKLGDGTSRHRNVE